MEAVLDTTTNYQTWSKLVGADYDGEVPARFVRAAPPLFAELPDLRAAAFVRSLINYE